MSLLSFSSVSHLLQSSHLPNCHPSLLISPHNLNFVGLDFSSSFSFTAENSSRRRRNKFSWNIENRGKEKRNAYNCYNAMSADAEDKQQQPQELYEEDDKKMNLNEYMVTLERPLGIRFALSLDGTIFVHSLKKGGNAEKSRIIMVGDSLRKASISNMMHSSSDVGFKSQISDFNDLQKLLMTQDSSLILLLERPATPFPIQLLNINVDHQTLTNRRGRIPFTTWNHHFLTTNLHPSSQDGNGHSGFVIFSPRFLSSKAWLLLSRITQRSRNDKGFHPENSASEIVDILSDEDEENTEWGYGSFPLEEYIKALDRAKGELLYNHSYGMQYTKITEHIYIGSCIQSERDVRTLALMGITAILNFQTEKERANWGINSKSINASCLDYNILMVNYPVREVDSVDLRKKLPFCVGLLLRLLRKNCRIFLTCTTGLDRSPACVIAYLHWIQDTALHAAHSFVTALHSCWSNRLAIVWATWDLIAMVEDGKYDGPPTHAVNFVWNNGREGEEVYLVGDFTGNWNDSVKASYKGGFKHEVELKLRHGKYKYKFIVGGQWKHSSALPTERDEHGNVNNVIRVGDTAHIRPSPPQLVIKDPTIIKVIERPLTEDERFLLAFAARRIAFSICPIKLTPK